MRPRQTTLRGTASVILATDAAARIPDIGIEIPLAGLCKRLDLSDSPPDDDGEPA